MKKRQKQQQKNRSYDFDMLYLLSSNVTKNINGPNGFLNKKRK
jgi:hypothetical protein